MLAISILMKWYSLTTYSLLSLSLFATRGYFKFFLKSDFSRWSANDSLGIESRKYNAGTLKNIIIMVVSNQIVLCIHTEPLKWVTGQWKVLRSPNFLLTWLVLDQNFVRSRRTILKLLVAK